MDENKTKLVYAAITNTMEEIGRLGISKDKSNAQQNYKFRGIDDVYNALSPILSKNKLCIMPRILSRKETERVTKNGSVLYSVVVEVEFDFICATDCSIHTIKTFGEAMDTADKATNKAMSAAYKYACLMSFAIPTEGDKEDDADKTTHPETKQKKPPEKRGQGKERQAEKNETENVLKRLMDKVSELESIETLERFGTVGGSLDAFNSLSENDKDVFLTEKNEKIKFLKEKNLNEWK